MPIYGGGGVRSVITKPTATFARYCSVQIKTPSIAVPYKNSLDFPQLRVKWRKAENNLEVLRQTWERMSAELDTSQDFQEGDELHQGGFGEKMEIEEACRILALQDGEGRDEKKIQAAHKRVMLRNHPDRGGSPHLATKINEAKEYLLKARTIKQEEKPKTEEEKSTATEGQKSTTEKDTKDTPKETGETSEQKSKRNTEKGFW